ncbi:MAG: hypothetical protein RR202_09700 [Bacteroidales bacterium]
MSVFRIINNVEELVAATQDKTARYLILRNDLEDVPAIKMMPFQSLVGEFDGKTIRFRSGAEGFCLTKGNELKNLRIIADPDKRVIYQDQEVENISTHHLSRLNVTGQISFILNGKFNKGRIEAGFIHVEYASMMHLNERPNRFGVDMIPGAFTIWNQRDEMNIEVEVDITHFTCGTEEKPIKGTGLLLCGSQEKMGHVKATVVSCGHIYTKGEIGKGIADVVAAGVAVGYEVLVKNLSDYGRITCYGGNEMGIYNWGTVERWSVTDRIETHGPNGCGFINAGNVGKLTFTHEIETFGVGARGFYMFDGVLKDAHFERIVTHGDAASAIQFNRYIDRISISNGIEVFGNSLNVMFADTVVKASADAINVKYGGTVRMLKVTGDLIVHGNDARAIYNEAGIEKLLVSGKVLASGQKALALQINGGYLSADQVVFESTQWAAIQLENAKINNCRDLEAHGKEFDILIDILSSVDRNIFTHEFLDGIFQKEVRIEYIDNLNLPKDSDPAKVTKENSAFNVEQITPDNKEDGATPGPKSCAAPSDVKPMDKKTNG